jgi:hypothetical protein
MKTFHLPFINRIIETLEIRFWLGEVDYHAEAEVWKMRNRKTEEKKLGVFKPIIYYL